MTEILFWGKAGCAGNARQIALLRASGHRVEVRDLRDEAWTADSLRPFFGNDPVEAWFNRGAPRVKRGEIRPDTLSEAEALAVLIGEPLLIRRPLLAGGGRLAAGFDAGLIAGWIGLAPDLAAVNEGCVRPDMPPCPTPVPPPPAERFARSAVENEFVTTGENSE